MKLTKKFVAIVSIALALLLLSSAFMVFSNPTSSTIPTSNEPTSSDVNTSTVATSVEAGAEYGDIMQYEWLDGAGSPERTRFSAGPGPNTPDVLWTVRISEGITGRALLSIFDGKIFVGAGRGTIYAFDALTGKQLWKTQQPDPRFRSINGGAYKIDDDHIFVPFYSSQPLLALGKVYTAAACYKAETGDLVWYVTYENFTASHSQWVSSYWPFLFVQELKAYYTQVNVVGEPTSPDRTAPAIACLNISDPSNPPVEEWRFPITEQSEILCYGDGKVFLGSHEKFIYALNASTGEVLWESFKIGLGAYSATYYNGNLYHGAGSTRLTCYDGDDGTILWDYDAGGRAFFSWGGAAAYDRIYHHNIGVPEGFVGCWDAEDGTVLWKKPAYYYIAYLQPVIADGKVYVTSSDGSFIAGRPAPPAAFTCFDAFTSEVIWEIPFTFDNPAIAYGNLYGTSGRTLYCFGPSKPWSMWRGNTDQPGVAVGQSGPSNLDVKWSHTTGGPVTSSPAVVDGKVYVGSHDENLYCLDAYNGSIIWEFPIGEKVRSSPAVVDGRVYTGADDGYIYCLNAETGTQIWKTLVSGITDFAFHPEWQPRSSPIIVDSKLYVGALDGKVYCIDTTPAANGDILWSYQTGGAIGGSAAVSDNVVYIASADGYLYALDATTETLKWRRYIPESTNLGPNCLVGTPVVGGGMVFITGGTEQPSRAWALDAANGTILYSIDIMFWGVLPVNSPTYVDGILYLGEGMNVAARDASNGELLWRQWLGHEAFSSVVYADDPRGAKLYIGSDVYSITCLSATDGKPLSVYTTKAQVQSSAAIYEGKVYVGSSDFNVYCFEEA